MRVVLMSVAVAALVAVTPAAQAASFNIGANARGYITDGGTTTFGGPNENYLAGLVSDGADGEEYRNYFRFSLPTFTGTVSSARLRIDINDGPFPAILGNQSPTVLYQVTSLAGLPDHPDDFSALGTGALYGSGAYTASDAGSVVDLVLNSAGIAALTSGGTFLVGGRVTNAVSGPGALDQYVFGFSAGRPVSLEFETAVPAVPEPESWAMMILASGMAGAALRRRRTVTA